MIGVDPTTGNARTVMPDGVAAPVVVPTAMSELRAETPAQFVRLLGLLVGRSGLSPRGVALQAPDSGPGKLNCSQAYSMLSRDTLPRLGPQVRSFAAACGLPADQVQRVVELWSTLRAMRWGGGPDSRFMRESMVPEEVRRTVIAWLAKNEARQGRRDQWCVGEPTLPMAPRRRSGGPGQGSA
jgi:hypothetical protein